MSLRRALPQRWVDALLIGLAAVSAMRGLHLAAKPGVAAEVVPLHAVMLSFLTTICLLAYTSPWKPLRQFAAPLLAVIIGTALILFNLGGVASRVVHAEALTIPFLVDLGCRGRLDAACLARYPLIAPVIAGVVFAVVLTVILGDEGLSRRSRHAMRALDRIARRPAVTARSMLMVFCAGVALAQVVAWRDWVEREPLHYFFFAPFELGPVGMKTRSPASYTPPRRFAIHPRPLVLITVDALRADKVGLASGKPTLTPFLRRLVQAGKLQVFSPAFSTCTYSYCGIMAALGSASWAREEDGPPIPIADVLAAAGYRSYFLHATYHRRNNNLGRLFGAKIVLIDDDDRPAALRSNDYALVGELRRLDIRDPERSFIHLHLMSAHAYGKKVKLGQAAFSPTWHFVTDYFRADSYRRSYDAGVGQADDVIRLIFAELERRGFLRDALVVITADHGDRLAAGLALGHGGEPDHQVSSIPLLIYDARERFPRRPISSLVDVAPTLLQAIDMPAPETWVGVPMQQATARTVVPIDSRLSTGAAIRAGGVTFLYTCDRVSGDEALTDLAGRDLKRDQARLVMARRSFATLPQRSDAQRCRHGRERN